jgi:uncharacterized protein with ParB-like and HNH nuclease domain
MSDSNKYRFKDLNVEECFNDFYVVPDYQREYVWRAEYEVAQLLIDLYDEFSTDKSKEYFIGTTVVFDNNGVKELIDGQQRTTTLFLMLCAFRNLYALHGLSTKVADQLLQNVRFNDKGDEISQLHLILQYSDSECILQQIVDKDENKSLSSESAKRINDAYESIYKFISSNTEKDVDELKSFFMYFLRKLKFIQILTPDINDALKIFETINDRGVGLNPMDLLKNLIFQQVERSKFDKLKDRWKELVTILEASQERPLRFLRYYIVSNYPSLDNSSNPLNKGENVVREDEIYKWFTRPSNVHLYSTDPYMFVENLIENARCYVNFSHGKDKNGNVNTYLDNITKLGGNAFRQHLILLLTARCFSAEMFNYLCKSIETYLFYFLFTKEQAKIYEKQFGKWNLSLSKVQTIDELKAWVTDYIKPEIDKKETEYKLRFLNFRQDDLQVYRVRYILAKIAQFVDNARIGVESPTFLSNYIRAGVEIEHILPWTALPGMKEAIDGYDSLKMLLGNLTLIEKSMNSAVGNKSFEEKVIEYAKSPFYITRSIANLDIVGDNTAINRINKYLRSYECWDERTIRDRQELLYTLSLEIWNLK